MGERDSDIITAIKQGKEDALIQLYKSYRSEFLNWVIRQYDLDHDDAADVFQDSIIAFRHNVITGKLVELSSSVKTYLFAIGKNVALSKLRKRSPEVKHESVMEFHHQLDLLMEYPTSNSENEERVKSWISSLGEPCFTILKLYYYNNFSMEAIANNLGYKNENVAKSQKLRCINALKAKLIKQKTTGNF